MGADAQEALERASEDVRALGRTATQERAKTPFFHRPYVVVAVFLLPFIIVFGVFRIWAVANAVVMSFQEMQTLANAFGLFYTRQYILGLPQDVFDAARVDGASEYRIFFRILVPMVKPAMATLAIIFSLEQWNDLLWPLIVMRSEDNYPLSVGITSLVGLYRARWDLVMTASVIAVVPIMILFFLMRKQFINGLGQLGTGGR